MELESSGGSTRGITSDLDVERDFFQHELAGTRFKERFWHEVWGDTHHSFGSQEWMAGGIKWEGRGCILFTLSPLSNNL